MGVKGRNFEWAKDELDRIARSDDLHISPFREDGKTFGTPTWIWSVVVGGALYVRPYNGRSSRWYRVLGSGRAYVDWDTLTHAIFKRRVKVESLNAIG